MKPEIDNSKLTLEKIREERLEQLKFLESKGINPYPPEPPARTHTNIEITNNYNELESKDVSVLGRITSIRGHGKLYFFDINDSSGKVQVFINQNDNPEDIVLFHEAFRPGDIVAVTGNVFKTKSGEATVKLSKLTMLAKAVLPPLFAGDYGERKPVGTETQEELKVRAQEIKEGKIRSDVFTDPGERAQNRPLDMIAHPEVVERFKTRSKFVEHIRKFFTEDLNAWELDTPIMDSQYGGASAKPFVTHHNDLNMDLFLRISNEIYLKKFMVGGFEGAFEFSRDFRNEGIDWKHNPEFTQVELYKAFTDYNFMMTMAENLIYNFAREHLGTSKIVYQGKEFDLKPPWKRLSIYDGIKQQMGIDFEKLTTEEVLEIAKREEIDETDPGHIALKLFDIYVEPTISEPTFVIDYPASTSPLTKLHRSKPGLVERFECIVAGMETMNCYTELNDPRLQRANFEEEVKRKEGGDEETMPTDDSFLQAMEYGMPPMGGIGISIDRFIMIFTNCNNIREVIAFPVQRIVGDQKKIIEVSEVPEKKHKISKIRLKKYRRTYNKPVSEEE